MNLSLHRDEAGSASNTAEKRSASPNPRDAVKRDDGFVASFFSAPIANWILIRIEGSSVTPNQVTATSILSGLAAAGCFATGVRPGLVLGAILLQGSFILDCLDGQLARHRGRATPFGAWLDLLSDRLSDVVLFAGIAIGGAVRDGGLGPFVWSYAALLVVFYRHFDSMVLERILDERYRRLLAQPMLARNDATKVDIVDNLRAARNSAWGPFARFLDRLAPKGTHESRPFAYWAKRALLLDGGERYLLISTLAIAGKPEWIFPSIVAWGGFVYPLITIRRWLLFG